MQRLTLSNLIISFFLIGVLTQDSRGDLVVVDFGTGEVTNSVVGLDSSTAGVTGLSAGISFDLTITANNVWGGSGIGNQDLGIGVAGGQAFAGIDNNFNETGGTSQEVTESMTVTVSNLAGAASIEIVDFALLFGVDAGPDTEYYSLNGSAATSIGSSPQTVSLSPGAMTFTVGSLDLDGMGSDSRYALDRMTVSITAVPEPGTFSLLAVAGLGLFVRRRQAS